MYGDADKKKSKIELGELNHWRGRWQYYEKKNMLKAPV